MESINIKGYKREATGKQSSKTLRKDAKTPCVLYGGKDKVHFYMPMAYLKDIIYTPKVSFINIDVDGKTYKTILQDVQFHPVSEVVLHMDFLEIFEDKKIKVMIPMAFKGESPGVLKGGLLTKSIKKIPIQGLPKDIPNKIEVDVSKIELGATAKVKDIKVKNYEILMPGHSPVASVIVPRALKSKGIEEEEEEVPKEEKSA